MIIEVNEKTGTAFVYTWTEHVTHLKEIPEAERVKLLVENNGGTYTAIDNTTGDCYIEDFTDKQQAIAWLNGEFEL